MGRFKSKRKFFETKIKNTVLERMRLKFLLFFQSNLAIRRRRNQLVVIKVDNMWIEGVNQIKNEVHSHFTRMYSEIVMVRPKLDGVDFQRIDTGARERLVSSFTMEEVEDIV